MRGGEDMGDAAKGSEGRVAGRTLAATGASHLILAAAGARFLLPLVWMLSTSLKPSKQTMALPPTWIPRATWVKLDGVETIVERERKLDEDSAIVVALGGAEKGKLKLLAQREIVDGKARLK